MPRLNEILRDRGKHWLESSLDNHEKTLQREPYKRTHFSPSQGHLCPRALYYHMMGYTQDPIPDQNLRRMSIGTVYHDFIEKRLTDIGLLVSSEEEVTNEDPPIRGFYDAVIQRPSDNKQFLLELKSMAEPRNPKYAEPLPKNDHLIQWNLYSMMTGITEGMIFYINKNNQEYTICEIEQNDSIINSTLDKFKLVQEYLNKEEHVPYQPDWDHRWCNYKATCERDHFIKGM